MKMAKKFLAVVLAGVLALSVLTGCGNAASTKTIADVLSDMSKGQEIVYKADSKLNAPPPVILSILFLIFMIFPNCPCIRYAVFTKLQKNLPASAQGSPLGSNSDDRRQRRKQGGAVGAAASRMQATA